MAKRSKIEWTEATVNPVVGCTKIRPEGGCKNCYAKRLFPRAHPGKKFENVEFLPEKLDQLKRWKKSRLIFLGSMGDIFHEKLRAHDVHQILDAVMLTKQHLYQILTKRPHRALEVLRARCSYDDMKNIWMGVSVEDQKSAEQSIHLMHFMPDRIPVKFVSIEPMIAPVDLEMAIFQKKLYGIDWVIVGGESGPRKRPLDENWVRKVRDQCKKTGVPFFYKQKFEGNRKISLPELDGETHSEYPAHLEKYFNGIR